MQLYYANIRNYIPNLNLFSHFCREVSNPALQAKTYGRWSWIMRSLRLHYAFVTTELCSHFSWIVRFLLQFHKAVKTSHGKRCSRSLWMYSLQWFVDAKFGMSAYLCLYNSLGDIYNGNTSKGGNNPEKGSTRHPITSLLEQFPKIIWQAADFFQIYSYFWCELQECVPIDAQHQPAHNNL